MKKWLIVLIYLSISFPVAGLGLYLFIYMETPSVQLLGGILYALSPLTLVLMALDPLNLYPDEGEFEFKISKSALRLASVLSLTIVTFWMGFYAMINWIERVVIGWYGLVAALSYIIGGCMMLYLSLIEAKYYFFTFFVELRENFDQLDAWNALETIKFYFPELNVKSYNLVNQHISKLKKKAEKWDEAVDYANSKLDKIVDDEEPCVDVGVWCTVMREELILCSDKLEAIKKWYHNQVGLTDTTDEEIIELGEILEAED